MVTALARRAASTWRRASRILALAALTGILAVVAMPASCDAMASVVAKTHVAAGELDGGDLAAASTVARLGEAGGPGIELVVRVASAGPAQSAGRASVLHTVAVLLLLLAATVASLAERRSLALAAAAVGRRLAARGPDPSRAPPVPSNTHARCHPAPRFGSGRSCGPVFGGSPCSLLPDRRVIPSISRSKTPWLAASPSFPGSTGTPT